MGKPRWQHLDLRKPAPPAPAEPPSPPALAPAGPHSEVPVAASATPEPLELRQARAHYHLRDYSAAAERAEAALSLEPDSGEARRILGMARGHLGEWESARNGLAHALESAPGDATLRAALQSVQITLGEAPLPPTGSETGLAAEMGGAACWALGQRRLQEANPAQAARDFEQAARLLARFSPAEFRAERVAACYVAGSVAALLAGDWAAAQSAFSRLEPEARHAPRGAGLTRSVVDFARQLYALADALPQLAPHDQHAALTPLYELLSNARLRVRFYDGVRPVAMHWENLV